jgi:hypothetical protein
MARRKDVAETRHKIRKAEQLIRERSQAVEGRINSHIDFVSTYLFLINHIF